MNWEVEYSSYVYWALRRVTSYRCYYIGSDQKQTIRNFIQKAVDIVNNRISEIEMLRMLLNQNPLAVAGNDPGISDTGSESFIDTKNKITVDRSGLREGLDILDRKAVKCAYAEQIHHEDQKRKNELLLNETVLRIIRSLDPENIASSKGLDIRRLSIVRKIQLLKYIMEKHQLIEQYHRRGLFLKEFRNSTKKGLL